MPHFSNESESSQSYSHSIQHCLTWISVLYPGSFVMDPGRLAIIHWLRLPKMSMISCYLGVIDGCSNSDNGCDSIPKICAGSSQTKFQQIGERRAQIPTTSWDSYQEGRIIFRVWSLVDLHSFEEVNHSQALKLKAFSAHVHKLEIIQAQETEWFLKNEDTILGVAAGRRWRRA